MELILSLRSMRKDIKLKFPKWCNSNEQFDLCLTNDIDSLLSCAILEKIKGYRINLFYNFTELYRINKSNKNAIGVDMALVNGKCWDNHLTMLFEHDTFNDKSANMNNILAISRDNYYKKYAMSTVLTIMSYYDVPLPTSKEGKMILLAIDSCYKGYYNDYFKPIHTNYLKLLEYEELIDVLEQHTESEFIDIIKKYNLNKPIRLKNNILETDINLAAMQGFFNVDLSLPSKQFTSICEFEYKKVDLQKNEFTKNKKIFSCALTYKNTAVMSIRRFD